ncbi:hypothetical protein AwWohl_01440 [Gammaproteobacteria bacterium]|nr:hypothetical protein AwWohl_01440 [Gammaproteobacteria bacterium]
MRFVRVIVIGVIVCIFALIYALRDNKSDDFNQNNQMINQSANQSRSISRADDPTYAEEVHNLTKMLDHEKDERKALQAQINDLKKLLNESNTSNLQSLKDGINKLEQKIGKQGLDLSDALAKKDKQLRNIINDLTQGDLKDQIEAAFNKFNDEVNILEIKLGTQTKAFSDELTARENELRLSLAGITDIDVQAQINAALLQFKSDIKDINAAKEADLANDKSTKTNAKPIDIDSLIANRDKFIQDVPQNTPDQSTLQNNPSADDLLNNAKNKAQKLLGLDQSDQGQSSAYTAADGSISIRPYHFVDNPNNPNTATSAGGLGGFGNLLGGGIGNTRLIPNDGPFQANIGAQSKPEPIPIYTIPDTSTLVINSMMTPLIGRVPGTRGDVADPFRFKFITGAENLATNGHRIPGIANIVWTGFAIGVRDQSCVRAYVDTVTYTFEDGRIHTVTSGKGSGTSGASVLGYLTDPWGKPCIQGKYYSNASQYLAGRGLAAFTSAIAEGIAQADLTTTTSDSGVTSKNVTGNTGRYIAATGVAGTAQELAEFVKERAAGAFDVIYIPSGMKVQLFVEQQINIDYDPSGRKISYDYSGNSKATEGDLD